MTWDRESATRVLRLFICCIGIALAIAETTEGAGSNPIRFETEVQQIFEQRCGECHGDGMAESGLVVLTRDRLLQGGDAGPAVVRGSAERSLLYQKVSAGEMPPDDPLASNQISLIRQWIDGGALFEGESPASPVGRAADPFFESEVLVKIFFTHCICCHGKSKREAGLDLRTRDAMLKGGKSGPALVPGDPEGSLVFRRLVNDEMPPKVSVLGDDNYVRRVTPDEIELLREWIVAGAPGAGQETSDVAEVQGSSRGFWAFQTPQREEPPHVAHGSQVRTPIDAFVLSKLESSGLELSPEASQLALLRRAHYDLLGLPPLPEEVVAYAQDARPDKYERLIERLLDSPRYGERWAQFWLDGAGYADSHGKIDRDQFRPYMWRYRDYVIRSLNADKPYDTFLCEQLAGDELVAESGETMPAEEQIEALIATGFLLTASDATDEAAFNFVPNRMGVVAEQLDIVSTSIMAVTLECARCHHHKFDPISQRDYYRVSAIFQAALDPYDWRLVSQNLYPKRIPLDRFYQRYLYHPADSEPPELNRFNQPLRDRVAQLESQLELRAAELRKKRQAVGAISDVNTPARLSTEIESAAAESSEVQSESATPHILPAAPAVETMSLDQLAETDPVFKKELETFRGELTALRGQLIAPLAIHGVRDMGGEPTPVFLLRRGESQSPGFRVTPGVPAALEEFIEPFRPAAVADGANTSGYRLGLARWLTQPGHPLTARVIVNRLWQQHFGRGLVATPGNFGEKGLRPTHPELLDWLATELERQNWSLKAIHRLITTSAVYRQASTADQRRLVLDPDNSLYSRYPMRRLDGEALRDGMLQASGRLDLTPFGPPDGVVRTTVGEVVPAQSAGSQRRSIYLAKMRLRPLTLLEQFDGAEMTPNCLSRTSSTVPTQALELQNSRFTHECAVGLAKWAITQGGPMKDSRLQHVYLRAYGRWPTAEEQQSSLAAIEEMRTAWATELQSQPEGRQDPELRAWESFCRVVLNSPEFLYVD